ncbi:TetR/AcrR family transcriptional regulator [Streptomyces sp. NPDC005151]
MATDTPRPVVRRPRVVDAREREILTAALEVMLEVGYEAMSMDAVASRARCGKATLSWQRGELQHRWSRGRGGAHPSRVLLVRNVETPTGSRPPALVGRPQGKLNSPAGEGRSKKRMPGRPKGRRKPGDGTFTRLSHNSPDTGPWWPGPTRVPTWIR